MVDVFDEVEEELRSEQYKRLLKTWGPWVAGVLVLALVAALSWWGYDSWRNDRADRAAVAYDEGRVALSEGDADSADAAFVRVIEIGGGYKALALQQRAGIALEAGRADDAVALFDEAARATRDPLLSDLARLKAAWLVMDTDAAREDVAARLEPLAADGRPYSAYAREAQAMLHLQYGETAEARPIFALLSLSQDVPGDVRQRAQQALDAIDSGVAAAIPEIVGASASAGALPSAPSTSPSSNEPSAQ